MEFAGSMLIQIGIFTILATSFNLIIGFLIAQQAYEALGQRAVQRSVTPSYFAVPFTTKLLILAAIFVLCNYLSSINSLKLALMG